MFLWINRLINKYTINSQLTERDTQHKWRHIFGTKMSPSVSKFQFDPDTVDEEPSCGCASANSHSSYLFFSIT